MRDEGPAPALRVLARVLPELAEAKVELARTSSNDLVRKARQKYSV